MILRDLIAHLQTMPEDLPVWFTTSDDPEHCYHPLEKKDLTIEEICTWEDSVEQNHSSGVVIGHGVYFP